MNKLKRWLEDKWLSFRVGAPVVVANDGKPVEEIIIRYKNYFFSIMLDAESGDPTGSFGWSEGDPMTHVPVREFYTATRDFKPLTEDKDNE